MEVYELTTHGGATDFARLIAACEASGAYCLIDGLAVDCYVEPVYTLDADLVMIPSGVAAVSTRLQAAGFRIEEYPHSISVFGPESRLRMQFTTDHRYQEFLPRSIESEVLGIPVRVACLEDVTRGKLWEYADPKRLLSKRKKDELDLIRLAEAYPELKSKYPRELADQLDRG